MSTLALKQRNGMGEEYTVSYEVIERCPPDEGVALVMARDPRSGSVWALVVIDGDRQGYGISPPDFGGRDRAVAWAMGYRAARADDRRHALPSISRPIKELPVGTRFAWSGSVYKVTYRSDDLSRVEATGEQFSDIRTFYDPFTVQKDGVPSHNTEVRVLTGPSEHTDART